MKKVIVIGANHAGTAALNAMADNFGSSLDLYAYDSNSNISFLGCGMALWIGKLIESPEGLFYSSPETLAKKGVKVRMRHKVGAVDFAKKTIRVENLESSQAFDDPYDELIIATGSWPIRPPIPGIDLENIVSVKLFQDAEKTVVKLRDPAIRDIVVVGAGYIGVELAEAFARQGKSVVVVDALEEVVSRYFDQEYTGRLAKELSGLGIRLALGESVSQFHGAGGKVRAVRTEKNEYPADMVMFSVGFKPQTDIFRESQLKLAPNGAIIVDGRQRTNIPDVYAIGDCATIYDNARHADGYIALASNAVRSGIVAGFNAAGAGLSMNGVQGSNGIHIGGLFMVSTGLSLREAKRAGFDADSFTASGSQRPGFMPQAGQEAVDVKVVFDRQSRRLLGAQIVSNLDISPGIHFFSLALQEGLSVDRLMLTDLFFMPHFNKPVDNIAAALIGAALKSPGT